MHEKPQAGFLHHNQIFDVAIEKHDYDIKNLTVMKAAGVLVRLNWTCGVVDRVNIFGITLHGVNPNKERSRNVALEKWSAESNLGASLSSST